MDLDRLNIGSVGGALVDQQMQSIERRGIPGINSDAYNLGYLEGTPHYRSRPPVHTEYDSLFETLYIFGAMVFVTMILSCMIFAVREYGYSMKKKKRLSSSGSGWSLDSEITLPEQSDRTAHNTIIGQQRNPAYPKLTRNLGSNRPPIAAFSLSANSEIDEALFTDARETARQELDGPADFTPLEVVQASLNYSSNSLDDFFSDHDLLKTSNVSKKIYSIKELYRLKPSEYHGRPLTGDESLENSSVRNAIKLSFPFQHVSFQSAWTAEKTLTEISLSLTDELIPRQPIVDTSTRKISILRFIAITANSDTLKNPNIFLTPLNRTMDSIIDSGIFFEILNESNFYVARCLTEVLLQYCYAHWKFSETTDDAFVHNQFAKWKMNSPAVQPHHVLFRYLVNLELGLYSADRMDAETLKSLEGKIVSLLIYFAEKAHCNDYLGVLPILSQAIEFSERTFSQTLFYHLLHILVRNHSDCCMDEYLKDDKSELKNIIQCGFWIKNDPEVRDLTEKTHMIILSKNPRAISWWKEIDGGRVYLSTSPRETNLKCDTGDIKNFQRPITPGSWVTDSDKQHKKTPV